MDNRQQMRMLTLGRPADPEREPREPRYPEQEIWVTRDHQIVVVGEMKYSHLCNSLRMVRRNFNLERYRMSCPPFPNFNGEMAQLFAENEWEDEMDRRLSARSIKDYPMFVTLCREHTRRMIELRRQAITQRASFT